MKTVLRAGGRYSREEIANALGLSVLNIRPGRLKASLDARLDKVFAAVDRKFRDYLKASSVAHGDFNAPVPWSPRGVDDRGVLAQSLRYRNTITENSKRIFSVQMSLYSTAPHMKYVADEDRQAAPHPVVLLRWAVRNLPDWWHIPAPRGDISVDDMNERLKRYKIPFAGRMVPASFALYRLWLAVSRRQYTGLRISERLADFTDTAIGRFFSQRVLQDKVIPEILGVDK